MLKVYHKETKKGSTYENFYTTCKRGFITTKLNIRIVLNVHVIVEKLFN